MRNIFIILLFLFTCSTKAQTYIILTKTQKDSLMNILLQKPTVKQHMQKNNIEIYPVPLKDSTKFLLPADIFNKSEWLFVKNNIPAKYLNNLTVRTVNASEFPTAKPNRP